MLNLDKMPKNIFEAVNLIANGLTSDDTLFLKTDNLSFENSVLVLTLKEFLINSWQLGDKETVLVQSVIRDYGIGLSPDIANLILTGVYKKLRNEKFSPLDITNAIKNRYKEQKRSPLPFVPASITDVEKPKKKKKDSDDDFQEA